MTNVVTVKDGVLFTKIAPAGFRILEAINYAARFMQLNLCITSACDGEHSGPNDPHHRGEAYDVRSHDLTPKQKDEFIDFLRIQLNEASFFYFLEAAGTENEHFHIQIRKGTTYP